jgi:multiple sugar transport system substrate-binding protein/sn-glycerol 3-phosphate transport system substrate-binding protein
MRSRTLWLAAIMTASSILQLCACTPSPTSTPAPPATLLPTPELTPTVLPIEALDPTGREVHLWHSISGAKEAALLSIARDFEQTNVYGIRMRVEFHSPLHREVLTAIDAATPPHIVVAPCEHVVEYSLLGAVVPLADYMDNSLYGLSRLEGLDLWPVALAGGCSPMGALEPLGLLFDSRMVVMYYNADWLEGLEAEAPPRTWDEFRSLCNAAKDERSATWGYAAAVDGSTLANWILGLGGALVDPVTGQALLDSSEAVAALSVLRDVLQDDCAYCASQPGAAIADFAAGEVLFTFGTSAELPDYARRIAGEDGPNFNWDIAPVPHLTDEPLVTVQGSTVSVLRTTPDQQLAAWLFLKSLLRPLNDARWVLASRALPTLGSTKYVPEVQAYLEEKPQFGTACDLRSFALPEPATVRWLAVRELLTSAATSVCERQTQPADALAAADAAADRLLGQ